MDMRMDLHVLLPTLQDTKEATLDARMFGVSENVFDGLSAAPEKLPVKKLGCAAAQIIELRWQRKCEHKMRHIEGPIDAIAHPLTSLL